MSDSATETVENNSAAATETTQATETTETTTANDGADNGDAGGKPNSTESEHLLTADAETGKDKTEDGQADSDGPPETYQFQAIDGFELHAEGVKEYETLARELGLSNAKAEKALGFFADRLKAFTGAQEAQRVAEVAQWAKDTLAHPDLGNGDKATLDKNLGTAKLALTKYGSPELGELMIKTGLTNNPHFIRFCLNAGKSLQETNSLQRGNDAASLSVGAKLWGDDGKGRSDAA